MAFRIYRRLKKRSGDFCDKIVITKDCEANCMVDPTAVNVMFIPKCKRDLTNTEKCHIKYFAEYHKVAYYINEKGEMIWLDLPKWKKLKEKMEKDGLTSYLWM